MTITTKFDWCQKVRIPELNRSGVVMAIIRDDNGIMYRVRYFDNGEAKEVWFYEFELEPPAYN